MFALDKNMNRLTGSIPYRSLTWSRRYYEPGQFEMTIPSNIYDPAWAYIYCDTRPETGMVQKVEFTDDVQAEGGIDTIKLSGFFMEEILNTLVFLVEETEEEEFTVKKPKFPTVWRDQKLYQTSDGEYIREWSNYNGKPLYQNINTGQYVSDPGDATQIPTSPGSGVVEDYGVNVWKNLYDYYSEDGKTITHTFPNGNKVTHEVIGNVSGGVAFYEDDDGSVKWTFGVVDKSSDEYQRETEAWEDSNAALVKVEHDNGNSYYTYRRTVKGPWQLRTDIGEVGVPVDNVQQVVEWAQRAFGNSILYDEPDFKGVEKVIDPSLKRMGDLFFEELKTVEASVRILYSFKSDITVMQVWRGLDRTQSQGGEEPASLPATVNLLSEPVALPVEYTELEYIENSSAGQYIDTGFAPNQNTTVETKVYSTKQSKGCAFAGANTWSNNCFGWWTNTSCYGSKTYGGSWFGSDHTVKFDKNVLTVDGAVVNTFPSETFQSPVNLALMCFRTTGGVDEYLEGRMYYCKVYDNGNLIRDYVPARRKQDNAVGMYDRVDDVFYKNSGTGEFTVGPVVERPLDPSDFTTLKYIQGTGLQYIDTGFIPDNNTRVVLKADFEGVEDNESSSGGTLSQAVYGSRSNGSFILWLINSNTFRADYGSEQNNITATVAGYHEIDQDKNTVYVDGKPYTSAASTFTCNYSLLLFAMQTNDVVDDRICKMDLYSFQIYDNGSLIRDYVPSRRNGDGAVGLFDTVNRKFYQSETDTDFLPGPAVVEPVETNNPWAVFSDTWGTLYGYTASHDESNYRNLCYVLYEYDEPEWNSDGTPNVAGWTDAEWDESGMIVTSRSYVYKVGGTSNRGFLTVRLDDDRSDAEIYLDLRGDAPEAMGDSSWDPSKTVESDVQMTYAEVLEELGLTGITKDMFDAFRTNLEEQGRNYLATEYGMVDNLDTGTLSQDGYMVDWDLGDKVDAEVSTIGMVKEARIIGVDEVHEVGSSTVKLEIGDELLTVEKKQTIV